MQCENHYTPISLKLSIFNANTNFKSFLIFKPYRQNQSAVPDIFLKILIKLQLYTEKSCPNKIVSWEKSYFVRSAKKDCRFYINNPVANATNLFSQCNIFKTLKIGTLHFLFGLQYFGSSILIYFYSNNNIIKIKSGSNIQFLNYKSYSNSVSKIEKCQS